MSVARRWGIAGSFAVEGRDLLDDRDLERVRDKVRVRREGARVIAGGVRVELELLRDKERDSVRVNDVGAGDSERDGAGDGLREDRIDSVRDRENECERDILRDGARDEARESRDAIHDVRIGSIESYSGNSSVSSDVGSGEISIWLCLGVMPVWSQELSSLVSSIGDTMSYIGVFGRRVAGFSGFGSASRLVVTLRRSEALLGNNGFADPGLALS